MLFTFPSRYYTLSVIWSYLALGDGPPVFRQDSSCPDVLRLPLASEQFRLRDFYPLRSDFPVTFRYRSRCYTGSIPRTYCYMRFGLFRFRSPLLSESFVYFLFLRVIRWFSSPGSPRIPMDSVYDTITLLMVSSLIRTSAGLRSFATLRSFSQLVTSFFGAIYQGILRALFVA